MLLSRISSKRLLSHSLLRTMSSTTANTTAAQREQEIVENLTKIRQTVDQLKGSNTVIYDCYCIVS